MNAIDTVKILGSLLGSGAVSKGSSGNVLGSLIGAAMKGASGQQTQGGGALGDVLGGLLGGGQKNTSGGGMADILGGLLGGGAQQQQAPAGGGLGDLLGGLLGGAQQQQQQQQAPAGGGIGDLLGGLLGGGASNNSGLGGAGGLGGLLGGALTKYAQAQNGSAKNPDHDCCDHLPKGADQAAAADQATLIIRAMINAAKSDGSIDQAEQDNIISKLGDISADEAAFVRAEFAAPLDAEAFARSIPNGMQQQIYALSLSAIDLDTNSEAQYLHTLAQGLGINAQVANQIHEQLGAQKIYA
ncbi:MAG: DUF533 domain-containing protein [Arenicellales bacterium]